MSQYNHRKDFNGNKKTCVKCGEDFTWEDYGNVYPGGKDREHINCPYCNAENGSIMTSGRVITYKIKE